jgi:hypothetical protein
VTVQSRPVVLQPVLHLGGVETEQVLPDAEQFERLHMVADRHDNAAQDLAAQDVA